MHGRERSPHSEGETQGPCPRNPAATQQETHTNLLDLSATELKDLQSTDGSKRVRQAASLQPRTCICFQLHVLCVHSEIHCCTLHATLTDAKAYVQYMAQVVIDSPMYCDCSRLVCIYHMISMLGHALHSGWFHRILTLRHHHTDKDYSKNIMR